MPAPINPVKAQLNAGRVSHGLWLNMASPLGAEIAGNSGFDWCLIDAEHGPNDLSAIVAQIHAMQGGASTAVRVPKGEDWMLKQVLDLGIQTVVVPMIDTAQEAAHAAAATRYPPFGKRGLGAAVARASGFNIEQDYVTNANDEVLLFVQAETKTALENIEEIGAVDGVDGIFIGPADLAASMGYISDLNAPEVLAAIDDALVRIRATGKFAGILNFDPVRVAHYTELGAQFLAVGSDVLTLSSALQQLARHYKD